MSKQGFAIDKVVVTGPGKADAILAFRAGLNVIAGASNTGKTYAYQLIDFMLGASDPPKTIPYSAGYSSALIQLHPRSKDNLSLSRALAGGRALALEVPIDAIGTDTPSTTLEEKHAQGNPSTISGRLLALTGLYGKEIRKNAQGAKRSLSFRDIARLILVDEERIITERSPALSGQYTTATAEKSVFGLFLTGVDDAAIVSQEEPDQRKLRIQTEMQVLQRLLEERSERFATLGMDSDTLAEQQKRVAAAIEKATDLLATQQAELDRVAEGRDDTWSELRDIDSRRLFLAEQTKRLRLLHDYYKSDAVRLESALEAGELFERLPSGDCPVCGHRAEQQQLQSETQQRLMEFRQGCTAELTKIAALSRDLEDSLATLTSETGDLDRRRERLSDVLKQANVAITTLLDRRGPVEDEQLTKLLKTQAHLSEAAFMATEVLDLKTRLALAEKSLTQRLPRPKLANKVEARDTVRFCEIVATTLKEWNFPIKGNVSWSDDYFDFVIGDENRGNLGKGYRAVTHAAFTIGLMRFCREMGRPHPGIVILDTPLNPFKGPDSDLTERVNQEVQEAFYANLAEDKSGDQIIIFENTEPPASVRDQIQYEHFSGNPAIGRAGFFPQPQPPIEPVGKIVAS